VENICPNLARGEPKKGIGLKILTSNRRRINNCSIVLLLYLHAMDAISTINPV